MNKLLNLNMTMNYIDTIYLERCIAKLDKAYSLLQISNPDEIDYDMYRSACVKEYEIIIEQCGKLLRKSLKFFFSFFKRCRSALF